MNLTVKNPYNGERVGEIPLADEKAIDAAIARAAQAFEVTRKTPPFERARILSEAANALRQRRDEFAATIVSEAGKPITLAEAEVDRAVITLTAASDAARESQSQTLGIAGFAPGKGHFGLVRRFPIGVIYGMTPFNFPLNLVLHKVAPAIATGNTIIVKPSPRTPFSALNLVKLLAECGSPENQVQVIVCPNELAMRPAGDERIKHVSFTGSAPIGWKIKEQAARKRVTLELGGNAALIVHDDADLSAAVLAAANGAFGYAGQSCISVQRILVQANVYDRFKQMLVDHIRKNVKTGDPCDRATLVGPMIDADALKRVISTIDDARRTGATVLCGGTASGPCLEPTIIENANLKSPICQTEIFAPVATLHSYRDFDQAIAGANDSAYGLQAGVFTRDIARAWKAFEGLEVGGVLINQSPTWRSDTMPYGGVKQSGFGREGIRSAMEEMTEPRTLILRVE